MAFALSGSDHFPSLAYTDRLASDMMGPMTIEELIAVEGTFIQTGINRFGDYAHLSVDPTDDPTFWYTREYLNGARATRVFSFKFASNFDNDISVTAFK